MEARFLLDVARSFGATLAARRGGRRMHPSWGVLYETLVRSMRATRARTERLSIAEQRRIWDRLAAPSGVLRRVRIAEESIGGVPSRVLTPLARSMGSPVLVWYHGGAYAFGSFETHKYLAARMALASGARVVLPEYRLAPEHPFPAAADDAASVYFALAAREPRVVVGGDSAGGGLAVVTCVRARDERRPLPAGAILMSPFVDHLALEAHPDRAATDWLTSAWGEAFSKLYLGAAAGDHPHASPAHADLAGLPPTLLQVGDAEILFDQCSAFADKARSQGVDLLLEVDPAMVHSYQMFADVLPECAAPIERAARFVRRVAARAPAR